MLDSLKFAFEILVVGALALPWLAILIRMFDPDPASKKPEDSLHFYLSVVPKHAQDAVAVALIVAIGYLLGSAVSRISRDFFNDEVLRSLPTEDQIREGVYYDEYCKEDVLGDKELPVKGHARFPKPLCDIGSVKAATPERQDGQIPVAVLYTAPASIASQQTVTITAASSADATKSATATITLNPAAVAMSPPAAALTAGQSQQFTATVTGSPNTAVSWTLSPSVGSDEPVSPAKSAIRLSRVVDMLRTQPSRKQRGFHARVQEMFLLQESNLLLTGQDKVDRLKQYYDQINVLRGAAFNGFILFSVCLFGYLANAGQNRPERRILRVLAFVLTGVLAIYGLISLLIHWHDKASLYNDPPLAELVLLLLGVAGFFVVRKAKKEAFYLPACAVAAVLTLISFGGWWWTEVMYDLQVIHSQPELPGPLGRSS